MVRHLDMDELLALRDGDGTELARSHLEGCSDCRAELDRLHALRAELRALPRFTPPRELWPRVVERTLRRRFRRRAGAAMIALAAAAVLAGFLVARRSVEEPLLGDRDTWVAESASDDLGPFIDRSRQLESLLRRYDSTSRVYDGATALAVSVLEDRINLLDRMLVESRAVGANREVLQGLWDERVQTLEALVGLQAVQHDDGWR